MSDGEVVKSGLESSECQACERSLARANVFGVRSELRIYSGAAGRWRYARHERHGHSIAVRCLTGCYHTAPHVIAERLAGEAIHLREILVAHFPGLRIPELDLDSEIGVGRVERGECC